MKKRYLGAEIENVNLNESSIEAILWTGENGINLEMVVDWCGQENLKDEINFLEIETKLVFEYVSNIDFNFRNIKTDTFGSIEITDFLYQKDETEFLINLKFDFEPKGYIKLKCNSFYFEITDI